jgi:hypothetical protein
MKLEQCRAKAAPDDQTLASECADKTSEWSLNVQVIYANSTRTQQETRVCSRTIQSAFTLLARISVCGARFYDTRESIIRYDFRK